MLNSIPTQNWDLASGESQTRKDLQAPTHTTSLLPWTVSLKHKISTSVATWRPGWDRIQLFIGREPTLCFWCLGPIMTFTFGVKLAMQLFQTYHSSVSWPSQSSLLFQVHLHAFNSPTQWFLLPSLWCKFQSSDSFKIQHCSKHWQVTYSNSVGKLDSDSSFLVFCIGEKLCAIVVSHTLLRYFCHLNSYLE